MDSWSSTVKGMWDNRCAICGKTGKLNSHHIVSKTLLAFRLDLQNGIALCPRHHFFDKKCSGHAGSLGFFVWLLKNYPDIVKYLNDKLEHDNT